ncbi:Lrp/AsnC family transcriptional regulator [Thalassospira lucentensis]|uniref:Lrp/AsnC family transcriptional regulator n=1 Tax=Thalassospira lucentensis TaxID=168935 RepID=UPI003AA7BADA
MGEKLKADKIDLKILDKLQEDCTANLDVISEHAGLSSASCHRRIKKLESEGFIKAKKAQLDEKKLGFQVTAVFLVALDKDTSDVDHKMQRILATRPEVMQCYLITGAYDFAMVAKFRDASDYTDYIYHFLETYDDLAIKNYSSHLVVRTLREKNALPLL